MSVSSENVGYTIKSKNPAGAEELLTCTFQLTRDRMEKSELQKVWWEKKGLPTYLRLGYQRAFSITQRREGQAELRLSIALTKTDKERGDILKAIPHSPENSLKRLFDTSAAVF